MGKTGYAFQAQYDDTMDCGEQNKRNSRRSSASAVNVQESSDHCLLPDTMSQWPDNNQMKSDLLRKERPDSSFRDPAFQ
jgi:hypothetical protein